VEGGKMKLWMNTLLVFLLAATSLFAEDLPKIVVLMPENAQFNLVFDGLKGDLDEDYELVKVVRGDDAAGNAQAIAAAAPQAVVVMENRSVPSAVAFQKLPGMEKVPIFAAMMLQVENAVKELKNVTGIKFEIPAYTVFSNLKILSDEKFTNVGVLYRKSFQGLIDRASAMIAKEKLKLKAYCVDCEGEVSAKKMPKALKNGFKHLTKKEDAEVMWILADNILLNAETMKKFWLKTVGKKKMPIVVPTDNLVDPKFNFGLIAFNPDYPELGVQVAGKIREVLEDEEDVNEIGFEELISVQSILNKKRAKKIRWDLAEDNLGRVSKIYE
jgi:ABC-type uncharacterized transport system substrate-binding protein